MTEPADSPRRRQLIEAAGRLFRASGFRAVTMEMIAAEAGVAKATLYSHFPDKTAVFTAAADYFTRQVANALKAELAREGDVDERLARGLIARHRLIFEIVDGSPHAREIMSTRDSIAKSPVEKIDAQMVEALVAVLREDPVFAKSAPSIARTLFKGCIGVSGSVRSVDDVEAEIGNFVRPYLAGLRVLSAGHATAEAKVLRKAARSGRG
jgi:AcrR family transcriptional regulator